VLLAGIKPRVLHGAARVIVVPVRERTVSSNPLPRPGGIVSRLEVIGEEKDDVRRIGRGRLNAG
jgi:hypothetical protein